MTRRFRLDLSALRSGRSPGTRLTRERRTSDYHDDTVLSRREVIGLAGAAAVGISPILKAVGTGMSGPFELTQGRGRAVFRLGGRDRWVIDTRRFSGSPELSIQRSETLIRLSLTHARCPGTQLPADMTCELTRGIVGWRMKLKMAFGRFEADVPFERWLMGAEPARSKIRVDAVVCPLGERSEARFVGSGEAEFRPDWTLSIKGDKIARIDGLGGGLVSDSAVVSIPSAKTPLIAAKRCPKRTLISLRRGRRSWCLEPELPRPAEWTFKGSRTAFDRITVEAGENSPGLPERSLIAESVGDGSGLTFSPVFGVKGNDGRPFEVTLSSPRYAVSFDPSGDHKALVAGYGTEPFWLHTDGCSVQMGDSPDVAPFEITSRGDKLEGTYCAPALLCVVAPLIGAVAEPTKLASGTTITIPAGKIKRVPSPSNTSGTAQTRTTRGTTQPSTSASKPTIRVPLPKVRVPVRKPNDGKVILRPDLKRKPIVKVPMNLTVSVIRPEDLLSLKFEFINLNLQSGGGNAKLVKADKGKPAYIVVHFPPQSIAERAYREGEPGTSDGEKPAAPPIPSVMAGPSRLSFLVPSDVKEIPYKLESLLGWASYQQSVAPVALPPPPKPQRAEMMTRAAKRAIEDTSDLKAVNAALFGDGNVRSFRLNRNIQAVIVAKPKIQPPELYHTAIEVPYRLILSPSVYAGWAHSINMVTRDGRTELWHTRLGVRGQDGVDEDEDYYRTLRAIWSPDYKPDAPPNGDYPFPMDISTRDRHQIVALTSDYITVSGREPEPVQVDLLMLTSLGAWMNSRGAWEHPEKLGAVFSLEEWRHRMTMGRDNYVRIVDKGFLLPFGHRAAKIKVTERKFVQSPSGGMCAYLRKREFIVVRQPIKQYPVTGDKVDGRLLPFRLVQCKTLVTPTLGDPTKTSVPGVQDAAFWPQVGGVDFQFHFAAEDWEGKHSEFTCPIIFVKAGAAYDRILMDKIRDHYHADSNDSRRRADMAGQKVAYAASSKSGDTTYETNACNFGVGTIDQCFIDPAFKAKLQDENQPAFYPAMISADVKIAAIQQLVGNNSTAAIEYHGVYVKSGLGGANKGEVFAKLKDPVALTYGGSVEKTAGVVSPNISIGGLSRSLGAIGGTADTVAGGTFDPGDFFSGAKILGSIPLESIISKLDFATVGGGKIPKLSTELIREKGQLPTAVEAKFFWETSELIKDPTGLFLAECNGKKSSLSVNAVRRTQLDGKDSTYSITSELSNFTIDLLPAVQSLVQVRFNKLKFISQTGRKADVEADIDKVVFRGPLSFINKLEEFLKGAGFSDPPYLDVTADHVKAGYTLAIPTVGVGVFSLQNIALDASLNLPFIGDPVSMRFAFCERQNPFILTVSMFGGGGFFGLELDPGGVKVIEGSLEFGGSFSLNLGVASGGVYLMGGISYARNNGLNELGGYVRCGGALSVLGLITVSMEFYLGMKHYESPSRMYGKCIMTVEIEILFFSKSVDLSVEREFGGGGDPTFADLMDRNSWNSYCEAFA